MAKNNLRPTSYILRFYDENGSEVKSEAYPMHKYSLDDMFSSVKGKESTCDIWLGRYHKKRRKYIATELAYIWENGQWVNKMIA